MRLLVLLLSIAMPVVAFFSQRGAFGPDNGTVSDQYPTLLVASGYAFAIWGVIFLLDVVYGVWQATGERKTDATLELIAAPAATGFALTAIWMPLFSMAPAHPALFWVCLLVIAGACLCLLRCASVLSRDTTPEKGQWLWAWTPLSLHAGWLSVAMFLNLAQVVVAFKLLSTSHMLPWSLVLLGAAAMFLLVANRRMLGNIDYAGAAVWGLVAIFIKQSGWDLRGADVAAWAAAGVAALLVVQTVWLRLKHPGDLLPNPTRGN